MKLTENQETVIKAVIARSSFPSIISAWELKHDRNLVVDELLILCSKLKIIVGKKLIKIMREIADEGK